MLVTGTKLGRYEIRSKLGAGGMGEVYQGRDTQLGRDVAVKGLPTTVSTDVERLRRVEQEACAASALNHPNILVVHDIGAHDGTTYVVSELLEGETLSEGIGSAMRLAAAANDKQQGTLTLAPIAVAGDTRVWLSPTGVA
jgi:serine/threonine protein kinase